MTQNRLIKKLYNCIQNLRSYHLTQYLCFSFVPRTIFFLCFGYIAYTGWLESFITPTSWIGIFAFWILLLLYPRKQQINAYGTYGILLFVLAFTFIIASEKLNLSIYQWSSILIVLFLALRLINKKDKKIITQQKPHTPSTRNITKNTIIFALILLAIWFFYPYIFLSFFSPIKAENPYDNLESFLAGSALIASIYAIFLQSKQLENEKQSFELQYELTQKQKIESNLFDFLQKYETIRKEHLCYIHPMYKILKDLYIEINQAWDSKEFQINAKDIATRVECFYNNAIEKCSFPSAMKLFMKLVQASPLKQEEQHQYYSLFIGMAPKKEQAIILTCLFGTEPHLMNSSFFNSIKQQMHFLFGEETEYTGTTETFFNIIGTVICFPQDEPKECLYNLILELKKEHEDKKFWWKNVDMDAIFESCRNYLNKGNKNT